MEIIVRWERPGSGLSRRLRSIKKNARILAFGETVDATTASIGVIADACSLMVALFEPSNGMRLIWRLELPNLFLS